MDGASGFKQLRELIRILERKLVALEDCQINCCGVTMAQYHALVEIGHAENISLNVLAQLLNLEDSSMSRRVNDLVNNNLVKREIDPLDRRYVTISLTDSGRNIYESTEDSIGLYFQKIFEFIPENKRGQLLESVQILLEAISKT